MLIRIIFLILSFLVLSAVSRADDVNAAVGNWQTINDSTKLPSSIVNISIKNGTLVGEISQLLSGSHFKPTDVCTKCPDAQKNKPIIGLVFLWGFVPNNNDEWVNGSVLDPKDGHIYRGTIKIVDNGTKMQLRGYWGPFWRTQVWTRVNRDYLSS